MNPFTLAALIFPIITIADQLRKPVLFLGVGQGMDDIMEFSTEWYLDRVLPN